MGAKASRRRQSQRDCDMLFPAKADQVTSFFHSDEGKLLDLHYNMYLMSFKVLLDLRSMTAHQVLLHQGRLEEWSVEHVGRVVFVSHEWLGLAHPDPQGHQLRALQSTLVRLAQGQVNVESEWRNQHLQRWNEKLSSEHSERVIPNCTFWLDFSGVPQRLSEEDLCTLGPLADHGLAPDGCPKRQLDAIHSIPAYVERSSLVVVLAPTCPHQDRDALCDVSSWRARGWCRAELLCAVLARTNVRLLKCQGGSGVLEFVAATEASRLPPGTGTFTCCSRGHGPGGAGMAACDKVKLRAVLEGMVEAKVAYLASRGQTPLQRVLVTDKARFLSGLEEAPAAAPDGVERDAVEALRYRLQWTAKDDSASRAGCGPSLLHWAARAGDAAAVRQLLRQSRSDLERPCPRGLPAWTMATGMRPLHFAACSADGRPDAMLALLDARADTAVWDSSHIGLDGFMWGASSGSLDQMLAWLQRFPDWNLERRTRMRGMTALAVASFGPPTSAPRVRHLLERGAAARGGVDVIGPRDAALLVLCTKEDSDPDGARLLLEAKSSANAVCRIMKPSWRVAHVFLRLAARVQARRGERPGPLLLKLSEQEGASALGLAAFTGHVRVAELLLQALADPSMRNFMGRTPLELARHRCGGQAALPLEALLGGVASPAAAAASGCGGQESLGPPSAAEFN